METFLWFLLGGPEAVLTGLFLGVALPLAAVVAIVKSFTTKRR